MAAHQPCGRGTQSSAALVARPREVAERLLHGTVGLATDPSHPKGCMTVLGALACSACNQAAHDELLRRRRAGEICSRSVSGARAGTSSSPPLTRRR
jgi:hypothetical protein